MFKVPSPSHPFERMYKFLKSITRARSRVHSSNHKLPKYFTITRWVVESRKQKNPRRIWHPLTRITTQLLTGTNWACQPHEGEPLSARQRVPLLLSPLHWLQKTCRINKLPGWGGRSKVLPQSLNSIVPDSLQIKFCSRKHTLPSLISKVFNQARWACVPCSHQPATPSKHSA